MKNGIHRIHRTRRIAIDNLTAAATVAYVFAGVIAGTLAMGGLSTRLDRRLRSRITDRPRPGRPQPRAGHRHRGPVRGGDRPGRGHRQRGRQPPEPDPLTAPHGDVPLCARR